MALGIYRGWRAPLITDPEAVIRNQLRDREASFLWTVRRAIFERPKNPYYEMFRLAGCGFEDLERLVRQDGLEATLEALRQQGVYLTHDELKGKTAIVRGGRTIPSGENSFLNPLARGLMEGVTSGSRSGRTRTAVSTEFQTYCEAYEMLAIREFQLAGRPRIQLRALLPCHVGLVLALMASRLGEGVERWFTAGGTLRDSLHYRVATNLLVWLERALGVRVPYPLDLPPNDFSPVVECLAGHRAQGKPGVVSSSVSAAVRVASAALEQGADIRGTLFRIGGETITDAKRAVIESAGGQIATHYWISEMGPVGFGCRQMRTGDSVHLCRDSVAAISHRRRAPLGEAEVDSLMFTTLLPFAPRVLINAETDDSGVLEGASCDCAFSRAGLTTQIRDIYSFGKLTGHGMTLRRFDMLRILETVLPARFGGRPGDYQLVEHENGSQTGLTLRVSPRVGARDSGAIKDCFLSEIRKCEGGATASRDLQQTEAMEVAIAEPFVTHTGKVLPLHLLGPGTGGRA